LLDKIFGELSGLVRTTGERAAHPALLIALHGGTYSSAYFNVPGWSLLDRAQANGLPIVALDRPGYGTTPLLDSADSTIKGQAKYLTRALADAWQRYGQGTRGIVLIGHSIGAAIAATIASEPGDLPLLGLAISGVGLRTPLDHRAMWNGLPDVPRVDLPIELKDSVMFGPSNSFDVAMPAASHTANAPGLRAELVDIVSTWHEHVYDVLGRIQIPVHYRQAEIDRLWIVDQNEIDGFARALTRAPRVDSAMMRGTGHCIDFHHVGAALQLQQLGFALQCASEHAY